MQVPHRIEYQDAFEGERESPRGAHLRYVRACGGAIFTVSRAKKVARLCWVIIEMTFWKPF